MVIYLIKECSGEYMEVEDGEYDCELAEFKKRNSVKEKPMITDEKIFNRIKEDYDYVTSLGYNVLGVFLQGSQNYNLAYEGW